ncbi:lipopolysaccharide biosynthesis protein [Nostocoides japonicum]|nr:MATE family efflux transporter [Tetrasphaera japonica]
MRRVARGSAINLLGAGTSAVANFGLTLLIARNLDRPTAGVFFSVTSLFLLATSLGQLGTDTGLVYFMSRCRASGNVTLIQRYLHIAVRPVAVVAVAMGFASFVFAPWVAQHTNPRHIDLGTAYLQVLAIVVPVVAVEQVLLSATRGLGTMRANALVEQVGRSLLQVALVGAILALGWPGSLALAWSIPYVPAAVLAWLWWRRLYAPFRSESQQSQEGARGVAKSFWAFSVPRALTSIIQVAMQRLDIVLVGALAGAGYAAIYAAVTRFIVAGQLGGNAISQAAQPRLAEALSKGDGSVTSHIYQTSTAWLILVAWPIYLMFLVFAEPLTLLFGHPYGSGSKVLVLLSIAMLVATGTGMVDQLLAMAGHTSWNLANAAGSLVVMLSLDIWLIPRHNVMGAAIGWGAAIMVRNVSALILVGVSLHLHPVGRATTWAAATAVFSFLAIPAVVQGILGLTWHAILFGGATGSILYLLILWRLRHVLQLEGLSLRNG